MPILSMRFFKWLIRPSGGLLAFLFILLAITIMNLSSGIESLLLGIEAATLYVILMLIVEVSRNITANIAKVYFSGGGTPFTLEYFYTDKELRPWNIKRPNKDSFFGSQASSIRTIAARLVFAAISLALGGAIFLLAFLVYTTT